jgi:hypothetical protein
MNIGMSAGRSKIVVTLLHLRLPFEVTNFSPYYVPLTGYDKLLADSLKGVVSPLPLDYSYSYSYLGHLCREIETQHSTKRQLCSCSMIYFPNVNYSFEGHLLNPANKSNL